MRRHAPAGLYCGSADEAFEDTEADEEGCSGRPLFATDENDEAVVAASWWHMQGWETNLDPIMSLYPGGLSTCCVGGLRLPNRGNTCFAAAALNVLRQVCSATPRAIHFMLLGEGGSKCTSSVVIPPVLHVNGRTFTCRWVVVHLGLGIMRLVGDTVSVSVMRCPDTGNPTFRINDDQQTAQLHPLSSSTCMPIGGRLPCLLSLACLLR